jgi:hypothetical protein
MGQNQCRVQPFLSVVLIFYCEEELKVPNSSSLTAVWNLGRYFR